MPRSDGSAIPAEVETADLPDHELACLALLALWQPTDASTLARAMAMAELMIPAPKAPRSLLPNASNVRALLKRSDIARPSPNGTWTIPLCFGTRS